LAAIKTMATIETSANATTAASIVFIGLNGTIPFFAYTACHVLGFRTLAERKDSMRANKKPDLI
jgi:hypothetical protein